MKIINWLFSHNGRKNLLWFSIIALIGITLIYSRYFGLLSISNEKILDMLFFYNHSTFYETLNSLTDSEILAYKLIHIADYVFAIGFYPILIFLLTRTIDINNKYRRMILLPLLAGLFDFLENIMMDIHLYLNLSSETILGSLSGIFTILKFGLLFISIIIFLIFLIKRRIQRK